MYYSVELLSLRGKGIFAQCWLAATMSEKIFKRMYNRASIRKIDICRLCENILTTIQIKNNKLCGRLSLYLASQLMFGTIRILSYQTIILQNDFFEFKRFTFQRSISDIDNIENNFELPEPFSVSQDFNIAQLDQNLYLPREELHLDDGLEIMMQQATCVNFGAMTDELSFGILTEEQVKFMLDYGEDTSLKMLEEILIRSDVPQEKSETLNELPLAEIEEATEESVIQEKIYVAPIRSTEKEAIIDTLSPRTPQKRLSKILYDEIPTKRRRLAVEGTMTVDDVPRTLTPEHIEQKSSLELESLHSDNFAIKEKLQPRKKRRTMFDKNIKITQKSILKWINNVRTETKESDRIVKYTSLVTELLAKPSTNQIWNKGLFVGFKTIVESLITSATKCLTTVNTEDTRSDTKVLPSYEGIRIANKSDDTTNRTGDAELSRGIVMMAMEVTAQSKISENISNAEVPEVFDAKDLSVDISTEIQLPDITAANSIPINQEISVARSEPIHLTKWESIALLEVAWHENDTIRFDKIIPRDVYTKLDAASFFSYLLELYMEENLILRQSEPYCTIWIQKHPSCIFNDRGI